MITLRYTSLGSFHGFGITWANDIGPGLIVGSILIYWGPPIPGHIGD